MVKNVDSLSDSFYIVRVRNGLGENDELLGMYEKIDRSGFTHKRVMSRVYEYTSEKLFGYKCLICDKQFAESLKKQHKTYQHGVDGHTAWYALQWETVKAQKILIKDHVIKEHPRSCIKCPTCEDLFIDKTDMSGHIKECKRRQKQTKYDI